MGAPPALDIDLLRSFLLIAEERSFTRAAERVGRTQSAVSLQMQRLESLLGRRVFQRAKGGGVQMTPQGRDFVERARELVALNDRVVASFRAAPPGAEPDEAPLTASGARNKPTLAVLPFQNMSGDRDQDYFVDGMVDDMITGLSRIKWLSVSARNSSFLYKGRTIDVQRVGRELRVRYILQGSVRRSANRLRIIARLVHAESGVHLWAEKYDRALEDVFDVQDEIAAQVVGIVEPSLQRAEIERSRAKRVDSLDAYDLYLRALSLIAAHMPEQTAQAVPLLERALELQPGYAPAHALAAWCYEWRFTRGGFQEANRKAAFSHARAAIACGADDAAALAIAGFAMNFLNAEHDEAIGAIDRGAALNPSCATALYLSAHAHVVAGESVAARTLASRALALSPFDLLSFEAHMALGGAAICEARYADAVACYARARRTNASFSSSYFFQAMALGLAGRAGEAAPLVRRGLELEPGFRTRICHEVGMAPVLAEPFLEAGRLIGLSA
jgi:adenylate cyclase